MYKYKNKNKHQNKKGGEISANPRFEKIESIGFEIETNELVKLTIAPNPFDESITEKVLINSALTNIDLEYGLEDEYEYANIIDEPTVKFKITNDSMEDDDFNKNLEKIMENCDEESETPFFKLNLLEKDGLNLQDSYDIYFKDVDTQIIPCSTFTDTEFIATYYKPEHSDNIILNYFFRTIMTLKQHIDSLTKLKTSLSYQEDEEDEEDEEKTRGGESNVGKQSYYLSVDDNGKQKELLYLNISDNENFNILNDLKFVPQLTFSCNVIHIYEIMIQLMKITDIQINTCANGGEEQEQEQEQRCLKIQEAISGIISEDNSDMYAIQTTFQITNKLINDFNGSNTDGIVFNVDEDDTKKIIMYLFLILYKTFIYINVYTYFKIKKYPILLKKNLSFAVRHSNYDLYLSIKKIINEKYPSVNASDIINQIISNKIINKQMYFNNDIDTERRLMSKKLKEAKQKSDKDYDKLRNKYFGDPLYTVLSYFKYFETNSADWLVENDVDVKSSKFDLSNDLIIVEFRDFPTYVYLYLFDTGDDNIKEQLLTKNIGTLNMKIVNDYIALKSSSDISVSDEKRVKKKQITKKYKGKIHKSRKQYKSNGHIRHTRNKKYKQYKSHKQHKPTKLSFVTNCVCHNKMLF